MEIIHYGVKGQKWGVRRQKTPDSSDYTKAKELRKKKVRQLTNDELKTAIIRMNLEADFKRLTSNDSLMKPGRKLAGDFLKQNGPMILKKVAKSLIKQYSGVDIQELLSNSN